MGKAVEKHDVTVFHQGKWLKQQIAETGTSQTMFCAAAGLSLVTLSQWLMQDVLKIRADKWAVLAKSLGTDSAGLHARLVRAEQAELKSEFAAIKAEIAAEKIAVTPLDNEVPIPRRVILEIPLFDLSVAAGPWADVAELGEVFNDETIQHGLFRVRLAGDSMSPDYKTGDVVEFECLRDGLHGLEVGEDYYVQKFDDTATFKRLLRIENETLFFVAVNKRKYPGIIPAKREEIVRMALAKGWFRSRR